MFYIYYIVVELQERESLHVRNCHSSVGREDLKTRALNVKDNRGDGLNLCQQLILCSPD
jgi:hypothetical protein